MVPENVSIDDVGITFSLIPASIFLSFVEYFGTILAIIGGFA